MNKVEICSQCKRPIDQHTIDELFSCKLESAKQQNLAITDEEFSEYFNKIKSGEFARMRGKNQKAKD